MERKQMITFKGCLTKEGYKMPSGKVWRASLPIALEVPAVKDYPLFVHHTLGRVEGSWTVTEATTGLAVAYGRTRQIALQNAESKLLAAGNERYLSLVRGGEAVAATYG